MQTDQTEQGVFHSPVTDLSRLSERIKNHTPKFVLGDIVQFEEAVGVITDIGTNVYADRLSNVYLVVFPSPEALDGWTSPAAYFDDDLKLAGVTA